MQRVAMHGRSGLSRVTRGYIACASNREQHIQQPNAAALPGEISHRDIIAPFHLGRSIVPIWAYQYRTSRRRIIKPSAPPLRLHSPAAQLLPPCGPCSTDKKWRIKSSLQCHKMPDADSDARTFKWQQSTRPSSWCVTAHGA